MLQLGVVVVIEKFYFTGTQFAWPSLPFLQSANHLRQSKRNSSTSIFQYHHQSNTAVPINKLSIHPSHLRTIHSHCLACACLSPCLTRYPSPFITSQTQTKHPANHQNPLALGTDIGPRIDSTVLNSSISLRLRRPSTAPQDIHLL